MKFRKSFIYLACSLAGAAAYAAETPPAACFEDQFQQPQAQVAPKVDFLIIFDTSETMTSKRQALAQNVRTFLDRLPQGADVRTAVMLGQAAGSNGGKLYKTSTAGEPLVLDSLQLSKEQIQAHATRKLMNAPNGRNPDWSEAGLYSLWTILQDDRFSTAQGQGFFRSDASLAVLFLSDENDICYPEQTLGRTPLYAQAEEPIAKNQFCKVQSQGNQVNLTVELLKAKIEQKKGSSPVAISAVVFENPARIPVVHTWPDKFQGVGAGYIQLARLMGGRVYDLADNNFGATMSNFGSFVTSQLELQNIFELSHSNVDVSTIAVKVDSTAVAASYIPASNAVRPANSGTYGSAIKVQYCQNPILPPVVVPSPTPAPPPVVVPSPTPAPPPVVVPSPTPAPPPVVVPSPTPAPPPVVVPSPTPAPPPVVVPSPTPAPPPPSADDDMCSGIFCAPLGV
jgi:hypothetical protein